MTIKWTRSTTSRSPCEEEAEWAFVGLQNESGLMHLKPEGYGTNCLPHFLRLFFFFFLSFPPPLSGLSASLVRAALQGAVVSERFLSVLNPSISLCPGKKYIRMKLKRPTGAKSCEKKSNFFPSICRNRRKKRESCFKKKKKKEEEDKN